jgi:cellulose synthase/poly-beta-1,6-N-acetylglucosamine synthase-like glycosyltransferase
MGSRVAIAMAVYNDARYLRPTLEALCAQTSSDFQLTLVDDASDDDSIAVAEEFSARLPMTIIRGAHRGRHDAKRAAADAADPQAPYLLVLDSDIVLPPQAIARMVATLEDDPRAAVISLHARSAADRPWGAGQAFMDDLFLLSHTDERGNARYIVGGCAMFRREAIFEVDIRNDLGEDSDLSVKLRDRWRLLLPRDLVATHLGVPTTLAGILKRFRREGVRVAAQLRVYPGERSIGNIARLVPLPLVLMTTAGVVTMQPWLSGVGGLMLTGYVAAFVAASRRVPASLRVRLAGAFVFAVGNVGFGVGYVEEWVRGGRGRKLEEPARA